MTVFTVHIKEGANHPDLVLVKDGFNWAAMSFGPLWALVVGTWGLALLLVVVQGILGALLTRLVDSQVVQGVVQVGLAIVIGLVANEGRRMFLEWRGCVERGVVTASNKVEAERRYLDAHPDVTARLLELS
jgi:hypothetical protein